jgi:(p)ppGpp synthase/HD superfamily hydrolase
MIIDNFSWRIAEMVDRLTRDRPDGMKLSVSEIITNAYQKQDNEVLLIKLIDRLHNMQTIGVKTPEKKEKICRETINEMLVVCFYLNKKCLAEKLHDLGLTLLNQFTQQEFSYLKNNNIYPQFLVA